MMIEALLVVLTNSIEGRDDDFNDWYTNIHTHDALGYRGSIAQQRFTLAADQVQDYPDGFVSQYLALYEVFDAQRFVQEHIDYAQTDRMVVEDSIDISRLDDFHYYPLQSRDKAPRTFHAGSVVMEQIAAKPGEEAAFREWYNDHYLPGRFREEGIVTCALLAYDPYAQLVAFSPEHDHVGIWRLTDDNARSLWRSRTLLECPYIDQAKLAVTCWDILTPRRTVDDIAHPTPEMVAAGKAARKRIHDQDSYQRSRGEHLKS
jgi:hypothetical protein